MADQPSSSRVIEADRFRAGVLFGTVELLASTMHGPTALVSVAPSEELLPEEVLKTKTWIFGAKQFVVVGKHTKPMKIPGTWYEVRVVKQPPKTAK